MNDTTLESSTPSKGKRGKTAKLEGNPNFNLKEAKPRDIAETTKDIALGAITDEDAALDREIARIAAEASQDVPPMDMVSDNIDVKELESFDEAPALLSEVEPGYKPASTVHEFLEQIAMAKMRGVEGIEATTQMVRYYMRDKMPTVGYFIYDSVRVYLEGQMNDAKAKDAMNMEQKLFGKSKVKDLKPMQSAMPKGE